MRDSKLTQALQDVAAIARTKLGPSDWMLPVMLMAADEAGFTATRRVTFDGELAEITLSKLVSEVLVESAETEK
jgi:hypothetical protein